MSRSGDGRYVLPVLVAAPTPVILEPQAGAILDQPDKYPWAVLEAANHGVQMSLHVPTLREIAAHQHWFEYSSA